MASFKVRLKYKNKLINVKLYNGKLIFDDKEFEHHFKKMMPLVTYHMPLPAGEVQGVVDDDSEGLYRALVEVFKAETIEPPSDDMFEYNPNVIY